MNDPSSGSAVSKHANLTSFLLIVGNARSGSTLLGAAIDAHPSAVISNESTGSWELWKKNVPRANPYTHLR